MKSAFLIVALALYLGIAASGCGSDEATSSETDTVAAKSSDAGTKAPADDAPLEARASKVVIAYYEEEGPFAAISGGKGNEKPTFTPSGQPAGKGTIIRDLETGSGPAAERGDEVSIYYAGADHGTGKVRYHGWPPFKPATFQLGLSTFGRSWEKTIEGMKVGGIRQVILTASYLSKKPLDYVIVLTALQPQEEES